MRRLVGPRSSRLARHCLGSLGAHGLRSLFTILSVALGVTSVTVTKSVLDGADLRLEEFAGWFGADAAFVTGGDPFSQPLAQRPLTLTREDVEAVRQQLPGVRLVTAGRNIRSVSVSGQGRAYEAQVLVGSLPPFCEAWNWDLDEGEDISPDDQRQHRKVCLLGQTVSRELFGQESPVGRTVTIGRHVFTVKGRLAGRGFSSGQADMDDRLVIPLATLTRFFHLDARYVNGMRVRFEDSGSLAQGMEDLRGLLRHRHGLRDGDSDDFTIVSSSELIRFLSALKRGIALFLGLFSAVTLCVGGIVLANLTYVVIEQRRQEIGILKALGARRVDIAMQFLLEIMLLSLAGSCLGMLFGVSATAWINARQIFTVSHSPAVWLLGLAGASAVALVFGLKPAMAAANLDPVVSLAEG